MDSDLKPVRGIYPNVILKKKLAPLPLFNQNRSPKHLFQSPTRENLVEKNSITGRSSQSTLNLRSPKILLGELKHVNNYGRLCDNPFLEFSSFHYEQFLGSGGKKKVVLEPLHKKNKNKEQSPIPTADQGIRKEPLIKVEDHAEVAPIKVEDHVEVIPVKAKIAKKPKKEKDTRAIIEHISKINDYEAFITFMSLQVVLSPEDQQNQPPILVFVGNNQLKKIYQYSNEQIEKSVLDSLFVKNGDLTVKIKKNKRASEGSRLGDASYPESSASLEFILSDHKYTAKIHYPCLKISVPGLDYSERIMLNRSYLDNLFDGKFNNLSDYISKFTLPPQNSNNKDQLHYEELEKMPTIVKKVIKEKDFGGLLLFKSVEIHLKNISDAEPKTATDDPNLTPKPKKALQKKKKNLDSVLLRLKLTDVERILGCSEDEVTNLITESIFFEEGVGFSLKINQEKLNACGQKNNQTEKDCFVECSEKFTLKFNQFIYEGFIKFPTLELYVPETSYQEVIQLKPSQIKDLLDNEFNNVADYIKLFKRSDLEKNNTTAQQEETTSKQSAENNQNDYPLEETPLTYNQQTISMRKI